MTTYRCPPNSRWHEDITGCGRLFEATPDHEGLVDCPHCGVWFKPDGADSGILARLRAEAQAEDDRLPRYHEDRPGRTSNNIRRTQVVQGTCTNVYHDAPSCRQAGLPLGDWCNYCLSFEL